MSTSDLGDLRAELGGLDSHDSHHVFVSTVGRTKTHAETPGHSLQFQAPFLISPSNLFIRSGYRDVQKGIERCCFAFGG